MVPACRFQALLPPSRLPSSSGADTHPSQPLSMMPQSAPTAPPKLIATAPSAPAVLVSPPTTATEQLHGLDVECGDAPILSVKDARPFGSVHVVDNRFSCSQMTASDTVPSVSEVVVGEPLSGISAPASVVHAEALIVVPGGGTLEGKPGMAEYAFAETNQHQDASLADSVIPEKLEGATVPAFASLATESAAQITADLGTDLGDQDPLALGQSDLGLAAALAQPPPAAMA